MKEELLKKIEDKTAKIGIIGLGYVGLPLLIAFAKKGFQIIGFDKDCKKVETLSKGISDIIDIPSEEIASLIESGKAKVSTEKESLINTDIIIICVPTPLTKAYEPDASYIEESIENILGNWESNKCLILESTTYPGTSRELIHKVLVDNGYLLDKDYLVVYSPERVDPGNHTFQIENTPKVVGGMSIDSTLIGEALYSTIIEEVVVVKSTEVAELSKLLENSFRSINIAFINEVSLMCERMGIDIWETIEASNTKPFGFMKFLPGPGVGGHCIPLDPLYLSSKAKEYNFFNRFIPLSQEINQQMPYHIVTKAMETLSLHKKSLNGSNLLIVGMSYKENSDDVRESPSLSIYENFKESGANVQFLDPLVTKFKDKRQNDQHSIEINYTEMSSYDLVVLVTVHNMLDIDQIAQNSKLILDTKNYLNNQYPKKTVRLGTKTELKK